MSSLANVFNLAPVEESSDDIAVEYKFPMSRLRMGVEIEVERTSDSHLPSASTISNYWRTTTDGSLADGREFVLSTPLAGDRLSQAISTMFATAKFQQLATSSTHIHMNMAETTTTIDTLKHVVALVYMLEPVLWKVGDPCRKWCGFTHSIYRLPAGVLRTLMSADDHNQAVVVEEVRGISRYFGLNLQALRKYGSLEFRYFPTATSGAMLHNWICLVQNFKRAAVAIKDMSSLEAIVSSEQEYAEFITKYFSEWKNVVAEVAPLSYAQEKFYELQGLCHVGDALPVYTPESSHPALARVIKRKRKTPKSMSVSATNVQTMDRPEEIDMTISPVVYKYYVDGRHYIIGKSSRTNELRWYCTAVSLTHEASFAEGLQTTLCSPAALQELGVSAEESVIIAESYQRNGTFV